MENWTERGYLRPQGRKPVGVPEKNSANPIKRRKYSDDVPDTKLEEPFDLLKYEDVSFSKDDGVRREKKIFLVEPVAGDIRDKRLEMKKNKPEQVVDKVHRLEGLYREIKKPVLNMSNVRNKEELVSEINNMFNIMTDVLKNVGLDWSSVRLSKDKQSFFVMDLGGKDKVEEFHRLLEKLAREVNALEKAYSADDLKGQIANVFKILAFILSLNEIKKPKEYWAIIRQIEGERVKQEREKDAIEISKLIALHNLDGWPGREN